jgi:hypothetical protein
MRGHMTLSFDLVSIRVDACVMDWSVDRIPPRAFILQLWYGDR